MSMRRAQGDVLWRATPRYVAAPSTLLAGAVPVISSRRMPCPCTQHLLLKSQRNADRIWETMHDTFFLIPTCQILMFLH